MKSATNRNGKVYIKLALLAATAVCLSTAFPARAVLVTTGSTTNFYDNFETPDTVGGAPTANVHGGTGWTVLAGPDWAVSNAVPPGAAEGNQYLKMSRPSVASTMVAGDFGAISSGSLQASFSLFIPTDKTDPAVAQIFLDSFGDYSTAKVWLEQDGANNVVLYNGSSVDTGVDFVRGVWQTWQIDYYFNGASLTDDRWTISVDGNTSGLFAPYYTGSTQLRYLTFRTGDNDSSFFLDAPVAVVPEPSTVLLLLVGGAALWRYRFANRR